LYTFGQKWLTHFFSNKIFLFGLKPANLSTLVIYTVLASLAGFCVGFTLCAIQASKYKKALKSTEGLLESERLMKEKLRKENNSVYQAKETIENELQQKLAEAQQINRVMDQDILLLQKSNEETEAMLEAGAPMMHALKLKLIEANNRIARYKAMVGEK
jgi:hypothetical protein